ncbi:MAG: transglutaminase-like cysteine peptidase, partial [Pseudomonadota bacterium]
AGGAGAASEMREGGAVRGPAGYYALCARSPELCPRPIAAAAGAPQAQAARLDAAGLAQLEVFNASVNARYRPMTDREAHGVADLWSLPTDAADCEDYVLAKRAALLAAGWPESALLIGVVVGSDSPYHAVLVVRTNHGELVLDNLRDEILDWRETGYQWAVRQSKRDPSQWVLVDGAELSGGVIAPAAAR